MDKQTAFKIVYDELIKCPMFAGHFDAKHGNREFMYGICTVMENVALNVSEETYEDFSTLFVNNVCESIKEAERRP